MFAPDAGAPGGWRPETWRAEAPVLADEVAARALGALEALMAAPRFRLFAEAPAPGDHYTCDAGGAGRPCGPTRWRGALASWVAPCV
jgi:hypothetical protein